MTKAIATLALSQRADLSRADTPAATCLRLLTRPPDAGSVTACDGDLSYCYDNSVEETMKA
jgi:hypothetical protein